MSRALRILGIVVGVLVVVVLVAPFLIPVNQFRPTIEEKASAALGRKVDVGNLSLSLFTGSLGADNLAIADDPKFSNSPFLTAKSVKVGVELMPLIFSKALNVTNVVIEDPQVTLIRGTGGEWNYSSLGGSAAISESRPQASNTKSAPPASSSDSSSGAFSIQKLELKNGRIVVGSTSSQKRSTYDNVNVVASDVSLTTKFPVTVSSNLPAGGTLKLDGTVGPIDQANSTLTPLNANLHIASLNLASTGFLDPSAGLSGLLDLNAAIASQNGEAQTKGTAKLSKALLIAGGSPSSVPLIVDFNTKYDLRKNAGVLEPSDLKIGGAVAHLNGTYEVPGDETIVHMKVAAQNMPAKDLEAFLPALGINMPKGASLQGGTMNTNLDLSGPTNKLVTTGNVGLFSATLAGFDLGSKLSAVSSLLGVKTGNNLEIEKLTSDLKMAPTGLTAQNFDAVVPSLGTLLGGGTIDSKNNLDFKMAATLKPGSSPSASSAAAPADNSSRSSGGLGGLLGQVTGGLGGSVGGVLGGCKNAGGGTAIPFQIQGTTSDPKFIPDVGGIAAGLLKSQLGCVGGSRAAASPQQGQQPATNNPIDQLGGLFKKKKP